MNFMRGSRELKLLVGITLGEVLARCDKHHSAEGITGGIILLSTHLVESEGAGLVGTHHVHARHLLDRYRGM